tara:strand:+ start:355 stop:549 length:195 start_codon:yes stop_codon:yes gene_type:complete
MEHDMTYDPKTYKKCSFVKLSKDPLVPLSKIEKSKERYNNKSKQLTEWRDGWFKGKYELPTKLR